MAKQQPLLPDDIATDWQTTIGAIRMRIEIIKVHRADGRISAVEAMDRIAAQKNLLDLAERVRR